MTTHAIDALDLWLIDKDAEDLIKPPPGVVYDRLGYGIVFMDARGRDFTFADTGRHLQAWCGQGSRLTRQWPATSQQPSSASPTTPTARPSMC